MDEEYDCIILGTGFTECVVSGLLSVAGKKVLHMDRNNYYGAEASSLNLDQLYEKAGKTPTQDFGASRDWNIDLVPKFIMSAGVLVDMLLHTNVVRYLEFKSVAGSYVLKDGKIHIVPGDAAEAMKTKLVGMWEKNRLKKFLTFVDNWEDDKPATHNGLKPDGPFSAALSKFSLDPTTSEFIGHAMALYYDESYKDAPLNFVIKKIKLYAESVQRHGSSPFIYSVFGLGELPQAFARLSAIYGGTYMLNKPVEEVVYENGKVVGVKSEGEVAKCKFVVGDPSYFPDKVEQVGQVVRCICILGGPIPDTMQRGKEPSDSCQIILPQNQIGRKNDMYISMVSSAHNVCPAPYRIAIVSTVVETSEPEKELEKGFALLGDIKEKFFFVSPLHKPKSDGKDDQVFISKSYDAQSHFETTCDDIISLYKRITGEDLVLDPSRADQE